MLRNFNIIARVDKNNTSGRGGGILVYACEKIKNIAFIKSYDRDNDISFQSTTIELKVDKQKSVDINMLYRSPNQDS